MSTTEDVDVVALETVTRKIAASVASVEFDPWTLVTPCSDWDLTALIDHIVGGNWFTIAMLAGERAEDAMTATMGSAQWRGGVSRLILGVSRRC